MTRPLTWVEVSRAALKANYAAFARLLPRGGKVMPVVKSSAYGHGMLEVARALPKVKRWGFVVAETAEALALRRAFPKERILLLSNFQAADLPELARQRIDLSLYSRHMFPGCARPRRPRLHVKIDTGTTRTGFLPRELPAVTRFLHTHPRLQTVGAFSHFADSEAPTRRFTDTQLARFIDAAEDHFLGALWHIACSASALRYPEARADAIRPGIGLYGFWPSPATKRASNGARLKPVLSWKTRILQVKRVPAGTTVGYGQRYRLRRPGRIAVLPVGYADGYDRHFSDRAHVAVRGCRAPVRGRVCMNVTMVDISGIPAAKAGDEVTLIGQDGRVKITADDLAKIAGTIHYEVVTRIRESLPRILT